MSVAYDVSLPQRATLITGIFKLLLKCSPNNTPRKRSFRGVLFGYPLTNAYAGAILRLSLNKITVPSEMVSRVAVTASAAGMAITPIPPTSTAINAIRPPS